MKIELNPNAIKVIQSNEAIFKKMANKYIWWKTPDVAFEMPLHILAQVMTLGDYDDMQFFAKTVGDDVLRDVLKFAQAGWFTERSWAYWHYRLKLCEVEKVPPMPIRSFL